MAQFIQGRSIQQLVVDSALTGAALGGILALTGPVGGLQPPGNLRALLAAGLVVGVASAAGTVLNDYLIKQGVLGAGM